MVKQTLPFSLIITYISFNESAYYKLEVLEMSKNVFNDNLFFAENQEMRRRRKLKNNYIINKLFYEIFCQLFFLLI